MEDIVNEWIECHKDNIDEIIKLVYNKPYKYLFINSESQRLLKFFEEIIISDNM